MRKQGNQKHLTFEQRVDIEKGLTENKSFAEIAKLIGKDPSTVSKEVRRHSHEKERPDAGYTNPPCTNRLVTSTSRICLKSSIGNTSARAFFVIPALFTRKSRPDFPAISSTIRFIPS